MFLIVSIGFIYINTVNYLIGLFAIYGLVYAITESNQRALVSDLSGLMRGTAMGFYYMSIGLTSIVAGVIAGALWNISYAHNNRYMF